MVWCQRLGKGLGKEYRGSLISWPEVSFVIQKASLGQKDEGE